MLDNTPRANATALADQMTADRFARDYGVTTFAAYLDHLDRRTTAHLDPGLADRVHRTAGKQRRDARFKIEDGKVIIAIPMNNPRTGETIWAELTLSTWFNLMECGADAAWFFAFKAKDRGHGQVRMTVPLSGRDKTTNATIARIIANAKPGQQARVLDRNPLNLRSENVYLIGDPRTPDGTASHAKTETRAHVRGKAALRATLRKGGDPEC